MRRLVRLPPNARRWKSTPGVVGGAPSTAARILTGDEWEAAQYAPHRIRQDPAKPAPSMGRVLTGDEWEQAQRSPTETLKFPTLPKIAPAPEPKPAKEGRGLGKVNAGPEGVQALSESLHAMASSALERIKELRHGYTPEQAAQDVYNLSGAKLFWEGIQERDPGKVILGGLPIGMGLKSGVQAIAGRSAAAKALGVEAAPAAAVSEEVIPPTRETPAVAAQRYNPEGKIGIVTPSAKEPGRFQATVFHDAEGTRPAGDIIADTPQAAIQALEAKGFDIPTRPRTPDELGPMARAEYEQAADEHARLLDIKDSGDDWTPAQEAELQSTRRQMRVLVAPEVAPAITPPPTPHPGTLEPAPAKPPYAPTGKTVPSIPIRDKFGKLRQNLSQVATEDLQAEWDRLAQLNNTEEAMHGAVQEAGYRASYEELPSTEKFGHKGKEDLPDADSMVDPDRLAADNKIVREYNKSKIVREARARAMARIEAELAKRPTADEFAATAQAYHAGTPGARPLAPVVGTGELKTRGLAVGVEQKAIERELTDYLGDLPEYQRVSMADQAAKAADLLTKDPALARRIALGEEPAPQDLLPESVFVAVENRALAEGDVATIRDLASGRLTEEATTMGQRIRTLRERNPESPVAAIQSISALRGGAKDAAKAVNAAVAELKSHIAKTGEISADALTQFIDSLRC